MMHLNDIRLLARSAANPTSRYFIHTTTSCRIKDYYEILSVPKNATQQQIKQAYYAKAKAHHPDANKSSPGSIKFQEVSEAYEILSDETKRRAYDKSISNRTYTEHSFTSDTFGTTDYETRKPMRTRNEPLSKTHLEYVYKTLNRVEEEPKFRPFEDHRYPGTDFNRFEYARHWNPDTKGWIYIKRPTAAAYQRSMSKKFANLQLLCGIVLVSMVGFRLLSY